MRRETKRKKEREERTGEKTEWERRKSEEQIKRSLCGKEVEIEKKNLDHMIRMG